MAALVLAGALLLPRDSGQHPPAAQAPADTTQRVDAAQLYLAQRTFGDTAAPLAIFEFSDFQCPYCREFWLKVLPVLDREYIRPGKARLVYLNLPISAIHPNAIRAHEFAMCAARDGHFRGYHDLLYKHQPDWEKLANPRDYFRGLADSAGLNAQAMTSCADTHAMLWLVMGEAEAARKSGLTGTPSFVMEGTLYKGSPTIEEWRPILDSLYKAVKGGKGRKKAVEGGNGR